MRASCLLAVILVLIVVLVAAVLVVVLILVVVLVVILILVLVIHDRSSKFIVAVSRLHRLPHNSGFIPGLEDQAGKQAGCDGSGNTSGAGFQPSCKDTKKSVLLHRFLHALGKVVAKAG